MKDETLIVALMVLCAGFLGYAGGRTLVAAEARAHSDTTTFEPGRYLIEPAAPTEDEPGWILNYSSRWHVSRLPARPSE